MNVYALNFKALDIGTRLFFTLVSLADSKGGIYTAAKAQLSKALKVTPQTVGNYIHRFVAAGMLKYKYSGRARINPEFFHVGKENEFNDAIELYKSFKSDI